MTIRFEILPTDETEREAYLQQLRVQIAAGDGPDIYLLPTVARLVTEEPRKYSYYVLESLFPDVSLVMRNRQFADLSRYYQGDSLAQELPEVLMDAGCVDNHRYLLPLRFQMMTYCYVPEKLAEFGLSEQDFQQPLTQCLNAVLQTGDADLESAFIYTYSPGYFSQYVDYDQLEVTVSKDALLEYASAARELAMSGISAPRYNLGAESCPDTLYPVRIQRLSTYLDALALGKKTGEQAAFLPLTSVDGKVVAEITYFAAVDAACKQPKLAYQFIRQFLEADSQWESLRRQPVYYTLTEDSWPVLVDGSAQALWQRFQTMYPSVKAYDLDFQSLDTLVQSIDAVILPTDLNYSIITAIYAEDSAAAIDTWLQELEWSLSEG